MVFRLTGDDTQIYLTKDKELVYRNHYATIEQLRRDLNDYVWWSDDQRLHSTLGYRSPKEFTERGLVL